MTLGEKQEIFTENLSKLIAEAYRLGYKCRIREVQRTKEQQSINLKKGVSQTMDSKHLDCLAADVYIFSNGEWIKDKLTLEPIGKYWESLDTTNRWGGHFKSFYDAPHFEMNG